MNRESFSVQGYSLQTHMDQHVQAIFRSKAECMLCCGNSCDLTVYRAYDPAVLRDYRNSVSRRLFRKYRVRNLVQRDNLPLYRRFDQNSRTAFSVLLIVSSSISSFLVSSLHVHNKMQFQNIFRIIFALYLRNFCAI